MPDEILTRLDGIDKRLDRIESKLDRHIEHHSRKIWELFIMSIGWLFALISILIIPKL